MRGNYLLVAVAMTASAAPAVAADGARVQIIHNAADPAAAVVDVWVGEDRLLDDLEFRAATPFVDVPADVELEIGVAPAASTTAEQSIAVFPVTFEAGGTYLVTALGVLDPSAFAANPDGRQTNFTLRVDDRARERARWPWFVDVRAVHGATDAPSVDIVVPSRPFGPLFDDLGYGDVSPYRSTLPRVLRLQVTAAGGAPTVATFVADLPDLRGGAAVVFASGFLSPGGDAEGAPFGLFAALPDGRVIELMPEAATAKLQIVHNAADPAAAVVDVYVDGELTLDDFAFRTATPFLDVPAGRPLMVSVAPGTSGSVDDALASFPVELAPRGTYVAFANGVLDPGAFQANPDGREIGFTLIARGDVRERAAWHRPVALMAFHGASDAPAVDVVLSRGWYRRGFHDLAYGEFGTYTSVWPKRYRVDVAPAGSDAVLVSYVADLRPLAGGAAIVFASGFLSPDDDQDGAAFGLFAVLPDGQVIELPAIDSTSPVSFQTANEAGERYALEQNAPNPFNPITRISFELPRSGPVRLALFDVRGARVRELVKGTMDAGLHTITLDADGLASGIYYYRLEAGDFSATRRMTLLK